MRYKREEAFRFQFREPLNGSLKIISINGQRENFFSDSIEIMDVSPNGLKFKTPLNLSIDDNKYFLEVTFIIEGRNIRLLGVPAWKKTEGSFFAYGFNGIKDEYTKQEIIHALKEYSKRVYDEQKNRK
ncbi:PilZ domain-containing protein [Cytobacillus dafuensis]|uniref:PilZ domain-containing protein n=1 Tax=Cytobacillus dafuensis TaxID=1742359 RepID=A0A5B8Z2N6_CYTDA|nr:PilZ domain-containing protein [Cytobacillus dafuensis]QED47340.1 hypothetical protein FSZ17_08825 [Cytobacillus dafuensis]